LEGGIGQSTTSRAAVGGTSFWGGSYGRGGHGPSSGATNTPGNPGSQGLCFILEW
jgi:hypothetical protein